MTSSDPAAELLRHFAAFAEAVELYGCATALSQFVDATWRLRSGVNSDIWASCVAAARPRAPAHRLLCTDPYTRDAFCKPRGYAGDAGTLDYVYGFRGCEEVDETSRALFAVSTSVPIARAVRARCTELTRYLNETCEPGHIVLSVAAGHMRELHGVRGAATAASFVAVDQDALSLALASRLHSRLVIAPVVTPVRRLLVGRIPQCGAADFIYASGLFDYLSDNMARALVRNLASRLNANGLLVIANLTAQNPEIAYMEAVMDWWMTYRTEAMLAGLASGLTQPEFAIETGTTSEGRMAWLLVRRGSTRVTK